MNNRFIYAAAIVFTAMTSCKKERAIIVITPPSDGKTQTLSGGAGGANAVNSVFVDFSTNRQDSVLRSSWDLGFFGGADFRVVLNYTASAGAKVTTKNDLAQVGAADTIGLTLAVSQTNPLPSDLPFFDDASGNLSQTAIPAVSANDADNKVIILNRGTGGGIAVRPWIKLRVLRNSSGGYTLQYARITEASFQTVSIPKDAAYNFKFVSLGNGALVNVEPKKDEWDMVWTYSVFKTSFGAGDVPYNFSDLVAINTLGGAQVAEVINTPTLNYAEYKEANVTSTNFISNRWGIGSNWRVSSPTSAGVRTDRFYVIKDPAGNVYKLKFISFHANDGGVRGYPVIEYKLVKQG
jgi:hypothetical protein